MRGIRARSGRVFTAFLAISLGPAAHARDAGGSLPAIQVAPPSKAVTFQQVAFAHDAGRAADSDWGQVVASPLLFKSSFSGRGGYVNVFLHDPNRFEGARWVVGNVFVPTDPGCGDAVSPQSVALRKASAGAPTPVAVYFDLRPDGEGAGRVQRLLATVLISPQPHIRCIQKLAEALPPIYAG